MSGQLTFTPPAWSVGMAASLRAASDLAGVDEFTIERYHAAGLVRVERLQGVMRYRVDDVLAVASRRGVRS